MPAALHRPRRFKTKTAHQTAFTAPRPPGNSKFRTAPTRANSHLQTLRRTFSHVVEKRFQLPQMRTPAHQSAFMGCRALRPVSAGGARQRSVSPSGFAAPRARRFAAGRRRNRYLSLLFASLKRFQAAFSTAEAPSSGAKSCNRPNRTISGHFRAAAITTIIVPTPPNTTDATGPKR